MQKIKGYTEDIERRKKEIIPGTFDVVFKAVLTSNKEYLAEIINVVTNIPKEEIIKNGIIVNSEYIKNNIKEKEKKSDLIIKIDENIINLEMDRNYYEGVERKNNKYIHKIVNIYEDKKVVQINFVNYKNKEEIKGPRKIIRKYVFQDEYGNIEEYGIEKYKIDLEYLKEIYYNKDKLTRSEKLFMMLKESKRDRLKEISEGDLMMKKVYNKLEELSEDVEVSLLYDKEERETQIKEAEIEYAKSEGLKQGLSQGIEKGSLDKSKEIAKKLLSMNMSIEDIVNITGLSEKETKKLKSIIN